MRLTNAKVKDAENETGKPIWIHDDELTGLALSISPRGKKVWYVNTWANGRTHREKLGTWPRVTATEARDLAKQVLGELAKGTDHQKRAKAKKLTVGDLWEHWFETHSKPKKRTWARDEKEYESFVKPVLHHIPLGDVERSDVAKMLTNVQAGHGKGPASKVRSLLSAMFEYAISNEWTTANPVRKTDRPTFEPRQRYLKEEEVKAFFNAVHGLRSQTAKDFILLCLWTGGRRDNVGSMEWAEIHQAGELWVIPAGKYKGKKPHVVPLSAPAMEILNRRLANRKPGAKYVFPARAECGYYADPKAAWRRVRELSGIEDLRLHDLRRSLGAWQNDAGDSLRIIQQTLGHANIAMTAAFYTPTETAAVRKSIDAVAVRMLAAAKGDE